MAVRTVGAKRGPALSLGTVTAPTGAHATLEAAIRTMGRLVGAPSAAMSGTYDAMSAARLTPSPVSAAGAVTIDSVAHTLQIQTFPAGHVFTENAYLGGDTDDDATYCAYFLGDVTIMPGVTVTTKRRKRGMAWLVEGTLRNFGTLTMTARGAKGVAGAALLVIAGATVPAAGGTGAAGRNTQGTGATGTAGASRGTGGGGAGGMRSGGTSGSGTDGTAFGGGSAGSGCHVAGGQSATVNGGIGGRPDPNTSSQGAGGGAGNPHGWPFNQAVNDANTDGRSNGTGGLLIVIASNIINETGAVISSDGSPGCPDSGGTMSAGGGGSGGGSVNLFYDIAHTNNGTERANGGAAGLGGTEPGGLGGAGTVTATNF